MQASLGQVPRNLFLQQFLLQGDVLAGVGFVGLGLFLGDGMQVVHLRQSVGYDFELVMRGSTDDGGATVAAEHRSRLADNVLT
jgi:hypothetical protein